MDTDQGRQGNKKKPGRKRVAERRNGVSRPVRKDGPMGRAWALFDSLAQDAADSQKITMVEVLNRPESRGIALATLRSEFSNWRRFHGFTTPSGKGRPRKAAR